MYSFFDNAQQNIVAAMSIAQDGNMKLREDEMPEDVIKNRITFCEKLCIPYENFVSAFVTHSANVAVVEDTTKKFYENTDALVTNKKNIYLSVTTADCFPVALYDPVAQVVGIAHAGWRGIIAEIIPATIGTMVDQGAKHEDIALAIGPGISQNQFDFDFKELIEQFGFYSQDKYIVPGSTVGKVRVNLQQMILDQAQNAGVNMHKIKGCTACTFSDENLYSARRHGGDSFSAMLSVVGMRE
ncbi:MAG: polyphenol oxidase family protein [Parcubacteria group bacterium]|jgi:hypothetical protein